MVARRLAVSTCVLFFLAGCTQVLHVTEADPRPDVNLCETSAAPSCPPLTLAIAPAIADDFQRPEKYPIYACNVTHWRSTLEHGFRHAFSPYFHVTTVRDPAGLVVELTEAEFELVPTQTFLSGKITGVRTRLHYRARLVRGTGEGVAESSGTVDAKTSVGDPDYLTTNVGSAVEAMVERMALDFFPKVPKPSVP